jgi:hypothetical protein
MPKRIYPDNKTRQQAYRERHKPIEEPIVKPDTLPTITEYFKTMTSLEFLTPEQELILNTMVDNDVSNLMLCLGRGYSKTLMCSVVGLYYADVYSTYLQQPLDIVLISSQIQIYKYINRIFEQHKELRDRLKVEGKSFEIPQKEFSFKDNGSTVQRILPTTNQVRSLRANILILDEVASIPTPIIKSSIPLIKMPIGRIILASTPHKDTSYFNELVAHTPENWKLLQYSSELAPWTAKMRELAKATLSEAEYQVEINGLIPEEKIKNLFTEADINSCIEERVEISGLPFTKLSIGIDFGFTRSLSCAVLTEHNKSSYKKVIKSWIWDKDHIEQLYPELGQILLDYYKTDKFLRVYADSKPIGFIDNLKKYCFPVKIVPIDKASSVTNNEETSGNYTTVKSLMLTQLYNLVKTKHLKIPITETELVKELKLYRKDKVYGSDLVDALLMSVVEMPNLKDSHSVVVINEKKFDHYMPTWKDNSRRWKGMGY